MWDGYKGDGGDIGEIAIEVRGFELGICVFYFECISSEIFFFRMGGLGIFIILVMDWMV